MSSCLVLVITVRMLRNNPGNAPVCPGLQALMVEYPVNWLRLDEWEDVEALEELV